MFVVSREKVTVLGRPCQITNWGSGGSKLWSGWCGTLLDASDAQRRRCLHQTLLRSTEAEALSDLGKLIRGESPYNVEVAE